jgi:tetratricopeptide (TPR) repeat protein
MSGLRWSALILLVLVVSSFAAARFWPGGEEPIGTESPAAAERFIHGQAELRRMEIDAARRSLAAAIEADPRFAMARFEYGHALIWYGDRSEGLEQIRIADSLAHEPGLTTELERLVIGVAAAPLVDEPERGEECFRQLVRDYPRQPQSLRIQAQRALEEGNSARARQLYREVLDIDPERVEIHNTLGYLALQEGRYEDAVASFKRYAYFAADSANPHDSLGEAYLWTGRYHESIDQYREALRIDPSFVSSVIGAADALAVTGQFRLAHKLLDNFEELFVQRGQESTREIKALQVDYLAEDWARVFARTERIRLDPERFARMDPGLRLWVNALGAVSLHELGRVKEAVALAAEFESDVDSLLARLDEKNLDTREDLQLLRASLHCRLALLEGRPATHELAALRGLIEASTRRPHRLLAYQGVLVQSLHEAGFDAEALELAPRILSFNPRHPRTLLVSAEAEAGLRNREAALDYLQRYLDVMGKADDTHPRVIRARQLLDRLAPSS